MTALYSAETIDRAVGVLYEGGIIAYPTETVYGLGCDALNLSAIEKICKLKGRDANNPMLVLIPHIADLPAFAQDIQPQAEALMKTFWPGPLTLLLKAASFIPKPLVGLSGTVGVRISPDVVCQALLAKWKKPIVSTSANESGKEPLQSGKDVQTVFNHAVDLIIDDGERNKQMPSTIADVTGREPVIIRPGSISEDVIHKVWGTVNE